MLGMYIAYWAFTLAGIDPYLAVPIAALLIFGLGALIQSALVQRVLTAHPLNQIILLLGVSTLIIGPGPVLLVRRSKIDPCFIRNGSGPLLGLRFSIPRMIAFFSAMVIASGLFTCFCNSPELAKPSGRFPNRVTRPR